VPFQLVEFLELLQVAQHLEVRRHAPAQGVQRVAVLQHRYDAPASSSPGSLLDSLRLQPYPSHLVQRLTLGDGTAVTIRPIRPEDEGIEQEFVRNLSDESRYYRFRDAVRELSPRMLSHFTRVDYDRHLALIAVSERDGREIQIGVARYVAADDRQRCEFAIVIADDWQRKGLGARLMQALMAAARAAGIREMYGEVLASNHKMLQLTARFGFRARFDESDPRVMQVETTLGQT